ncbi:hypothetical protein STVIR_3581 [Streptomyces viridochromogenes Tue57]|uniref:N-acetyltransferase domain-containing protein n=1 Tax=Streptomyces viridochromogenes Tue57 TaxID=1160705 RepID=L8PD35_STRVR|nr:hypothetical protein STVIR_3581 [Streptomyces viridochromogenes Tue57]
MARTREGEPAGSHIPAHHPQGPCIGFIGVLPEHRGHGYAYDLLAECAHFAKAGHPVVRERTHLDAP